MAFNSPRDLLMALLASNSPRDFFQSQQGIMSPEQGGPQYIGMGKPVNPKYIGRGTPVEPQYIGLGEPTGYDRPHTNESLMPSGITPYEGKRGGGGQSNQAKISIALPASKLFETDSSGGPAVGPMSPNLPYPNVGQSPGALGYTPVGQMGPSYTPYDPNSERPFYSQMRGK